MQVNNENKEFYETLLTLCREKLEVLEESDGQFTSGFYHQKFKTDDNYLLTFYIDGEELCDVEVETP